MGTLCSINYKPSNASEQIQLVGAIAVGYANESPGQRPRKEMDEIVEYRL